MEQESTYKSIAIIGQGAAGGFCSVLLSKNPYCNVIAFDLKDPFSTLLPTGGGRCNLTNSIEDVREFVKNYPRGEKFLLSVFSKCSNKKTVEIFKDLGIKTYVQDDNRVFPISDSALKTIKTLNSHLNVPNYKHIKEKVIEVKRVDDKFILKTENKEYFSDYLIIATGGKGNGFKIAKDLGHKIVDTRPSLCSFDIKEKYFYNLSGLCFKNVEISAFSKNKKYPTVLGDILFAHKFITGPAIFKVSAITAYENFDENNPLKLKIKLVDVGSDEIEEEIKNNSKKSIKNLFSKFVPSRYIQEILNVNNIDCDKQCAQLKKHEKEILINSIIALEINVQTRIKDSEIVTAGGVDLKEINSKTMESKLVSGLYFVGEVLDIDGFTGGFNLQNCWSSAYLCAMDF